MIFLAHSLEFLRNSLARSHYTVMYNSRGPQNYLAPLPTAPVVARALPLPALPRSTRLSLASPGGAAFCCKAWRSVARSRLALALAPGLLLDSNLALHVASLT